MAINEMRSVAGAQRKRNSPEKSQSDQPQERSMSNVTHEEISKTSKPGEAAEAEERRHWNRRIEALESSVGKLESGIVVNFEQIKAVRYELDESKEQLRRRLEEFGLQIGAVNQEAVHSQTDVGALTTQVGQLATDLANTEAQQGNLSSRIDQLSGAIKAAQDSMVSVNTQAAQAAQEAAAAQQAVNALSNEALPDIKQLQTAVSEKQLDSRALLDALKSAILPRLDKLEKAVAEKLPQTQESHDFNLTFPSFPKNVTVTVDVLDAEQKRIITLKPGSDGKLSVVGSKGEKRTFVLRVDGVEIERVPLTA